MRSGGSLLVLLWGDGEENARSIQQTTCSYKLGLINLKSYAWLREGERAAVLCDKFNSLMIMTVKNTSSRWFAKFQDTVYESIETARVSCTLIKITPFNNSWQEELLKSYLVLKKSSMLFISADISRSSYRDYSGKKLLKWFILPTYSFHIIHFQQCLVWTVTGD